jgi:hypothetical protein
MRRLKVLAVALAMTLAFAVPAAAQATFDQSDAGEVRITVGGANVEADAGFFAGNTGEAAVGGFVAEGDDEFLFFGENLF